jgi:hypothetical protein
VLVDAENLIVLVLSVVSAKKFVAVVNSLLVIVSVVSFPTSVSVASGRVIVLFVVWLLAIVIVEDAVAPPNENFNALEAVVTLVKVHVESLNDLFVNV